MSAQVIVQQGKGEGRPEQLTERMPLALEIAKGDNKPSSKKKSLVSVVGRITAPLKGIHILIPRTWEYVASFDKRD